PYELSLQQQINLTRDFVQQNFISKGMIADINIHHKEGNPHAHIMLTMREIDQNGFGLKVREWNKKENILQWREKWAEIQNLYLTKAGKDVKVDHRSHKERGLKTAPQIRINGQQKKAYDKQKGQDKYIKQQESQSQGTHSKQQESQSQKTHSKQQEIEIEPQHAYIYDETLKEIEVLEKNERFQAFLRIARENGDKIIQNPEIAIDELSHHHAVFKENDIFRNAHLHSADEKQFHEVCAAIQKSPELVCIGEDEKGKRCYTTETMLKNEREMLGGIRELANKDKHNVHPSIINQTIKNYTMTDEQLKAFQHIIKNGDISVVVGHAGTGKSYLLGAVHEAYKAQGFNVKGVALSGIAAENLENESGISSRTIHSQLYQWERGKNELNAKSVLVIDEAGMVGTRQAHELIKYAHSKGAKVVMVGDHEQLQAIEAGGPFRAILNRVGYADLQNVMRQKQSWQKEATKALSKSANGVASALDKYREHD
ncbi:MAG: AAA family ATPase, partial [Lentisphaerae bacterium]|nr:AAA family ATPase [Lentisphaerota bacterium]